MIISGLTSKSDGATQPFFDLDTLLRDAPDGPSCRQLCTAFRTTHHAIVRLPAADIPRMDAMWRAARAFFALDAARKLTAGGGPFRRLDGVVGVAGYAQMEDGNEFLEMRVGDAGALLPPPAAVDAEIPGFTEALGAARAVLTGVAQTGDRGSVRPTPTPIPPPPSPSSPQVPTLHSINYHPAAPDPPHIPHGGNAL